MMPPTFDFSRADLVVFLGAVAGCVVLVVLVYVIGDLVLDLYTEDFRTLLSLSLSIILVFFLGYLWMENVNFLTVGKVVVARRFMATRGTSLESRTVGFPAMTSRKTLAAASSNGMR